MRVAVYLGRPSLSDVRFSEYAGELLSELLLLLEADANRELELVLYIHESLLTPSLNEQLHLSPVLCSFTQSGILAGASRYFRTLPNGARSRVLVRKLNTFFGAKLDRLFDVVALPLLFIRDGIDVIHSVDKPNTFLARCPQLANVWSSTGGEESGGESKAPRRKAFLSANGILSNSIAQRAIKFQQHLIVGNPELANSVYRSYSYDSAHISVIPLGLDSCFLDYWLELKRDSRQVCSRADAWYKDAFAEKSGISPGYLLASSCSRKPAELKSVLNAWQTIPEELKARGLVISLKSRQSEKLVKQMVEGKEFADRVHVFRGLDRYELPYLLHFAAAQLLLDFEPGLDYRGLQSELIGCAQIVDVRGVDRPGAGNSAHVYGVDFADVTEISAVMSTALTEAKLVRPHEPRKGEFVLSRSRKLKNGQALPRGMSDYVWDVLGAYRQLGLRFRYRGR